MDYPTVRTIIIIVVILLCCGGGAAIGIVLGAAHLRSDYDRLRDDTAQMDRLNEIEREK